MSATLGEIVQLCQEISSWNDPNYASRWRSFINRALREYARQQPWPSLEDEVDVIATGRFLILPYFVDSVIDVLNLSDDSHVDRGSEWSRQFPSTTSQGTTGKVLEYDHLGHVPSTGDPSGFLYFRSTDASDVQQLFVTGLASNSGASGTPLETTIANTSAFASGLSPVTLSTQLTRILSISKATDTNGDYFIHDASDGSHLSFISADSRVAGFKRLQLRFVPDENTEFRVRFRHRPAPLRNDDQSPHPSVETDFLLHYALSLHYTEQEQFQKAQLSEQQALRVAAAEANKNSTFEEPDNRLLPQELFWRDPDSDEFAGWGR